MPESPLFRDIILLEPDLLTEKPYWAGHLPFAFWLMDVHRPRILVELGTETGVSYCGFCQAVKHLDLPTACYAVDTWQGDAHTGEYEESVFLTLQAYHDPRYGAFSRLIRSTFEAALPHFNDNSIDLLHIDGWHTYEAVRRDFELWQPKLSDRAVVLFHDTNVRERDYMVWKYWEEISPSRPSFTFLHCNGLGVLAWGRELPDEVCWLTRSEENDPGHAARVRRFFGVLGGRLEERSLRLGQEAPGTA